MSNNNFLNPAFEDIFEGITSRMPAITFYGIIGIYIVTAALNMFFIPLPIWLSAPASIAIVFARFSIVFMDFLNPTGRRSPYPALVATLATGVACIELYFSAQPYFSGVEFYAVYLFGAMLIGMGYLLEINFIAKGAEAFGMVSAEKRKGATHKARPVPRGAIEPEEDFFDLPLPDFRGNGNGTH